MKLTSLIIAITLAAPAFAGGPVIVTEESTEVAPAHNKRVPGWVAPVLGLLLVGVIVASGGDSGGGAVCTTEEPGPTPGGCQ